jgi:LacI family transcriptional regulator
MRSPDITSSRPTTMRDIAAAVGVHQTTVSLALRNHPSISLETRERVRAAADRLGYRPNPLLSAFNFHRVASHPVKGGPTIAMVFDGRMQPRSTNHEYPRLLLAAARAAAAERGYRIEPFVLAEDNLRPKRLSRMLAARGIHAAILTTFGVDTPELDLDWRRLCAVKIESVHVAPALDTVSNDQWQTTRLGLRHLRELGYRRVGLVAAIEDEERLGEPFRTGMLVEQAVIPERERVPTLLFSGRTEMPLHERLLEWARKHRVDAIMSNWNNVIDLVRQCGWRVPEDVAVVSLDLPQRSSELAGVVQNHALVARRAVEHVALLLQVNQRGVPEMASVTYVPGKWRDGPSAPRK